MQLFQMKFSGSINIGHSALSPGLFYVLVSCGVGRFGGEESIELNVERGEVV